MDARRPLATLTLIAALGLTACGGDNDPSAEPPTTAPPEPADTRPTSPGESRFPASFVKRVEPICVQSQRSIDDLAPIEDEAALRKAAAVYEDAATKFGELKPPQENAGAFRRFVEVYRDAAKTLNGILGEVNRGDSGAFQRVQPVLDNVASEGGDAAEDYGFTKCTSG
jgi:hypothetical protein